MKTALLLIGHGSSIAEANTSLHAIAAMIRNRAIFDWVEVSFLGRHAVGIQDKINEFVHGGA